MGSGYGSGVWVGVWLGDMGRLRAGVCPIPCGPQLGGMSWEHGLGIWVCIGGLDWVPILGWKAGIILSNSKRKFEEVNHLNFIIF